MKTTMRLQTAAAMTTMLVLTGCDLGQDPPAPSAPAVTTPDERKPVEPASAAAAPQLQAKAPGNAAQAPGGPTVEASPSGPPPPADTSSVETTTTPVAAATAPTPAVTAPTPAAAATPASTQPAAPIVRMALTNDIKVEMPSLHQEASGTPCSSGQEALMREDGVLHYRAGATIRSCDGQEWTLKSESRHEDVWQPDQSGNLYSATARHDRATLTYEIVVVKLDPAGKTMWEQSVPTGKTRPTPAFMRVSPGGLYVGGTADGQLPGNPPEARGKPWILRYDDDGKLEWLKQMRKDLNSNDGYEPLSHANVAIDGSDHLYLLRTLGVEHTIYKLDRNGEPMWTTSIGRNRCEGRLEAASDGSAIFYGGTARGGQYRSAACITKLDEKGRVVWSNTYAPSHSVVVDQAEGTTWNGQHSGHVSFSVGESTVTLVGNYQNRYEHGSQPPPDFDSAWIVELDFDGQVQSSRNLRVGPLDVRPSESGSSVSFSPWLARLLPNGALRLVGTQSNERNRMTLVVTLPGQDTTTTGSGTAASTSPALSSLWGRLGG